jgi:hypothetical protein
MTPQNRPLDSLKTHNMKSPDRLEAEEANALAEYGISTVAVYEASIQAADLSQQPTANQLAERMFSYARDTVRQPPGTTIFVAVEFDPTEEQIANQVIPFFKVLNDVNLAQPDPYRRYRIGVYGSGLVIRQLQAARLVELSWLAAPRQWRGYAQTIENAAWDLRHTSVDAPSYCGLLWDTSIFKASLPNTAFAFSSGPKGSVNR